MPASLMIQSLDLLNNPAIAHLASITHSPLLIGSLGHFEAIDRADLTAWLESIAKLDITQSIQPHKFTRIGLYYEALIEFLCTVAYRAGVFPYELITKNLQVNTSRSTLGEFDFLLRDQDGTVIHLETAVKFFLLSDKYQGDSQNWSSWVGPNSRDRLDLKLKHMRDHQLTLSQQQECIPLLKTYNVDPKQIRIHHLIQGQLFIKLSNNSVLGKSEYCPSDCNPEIVSGYWVRKSELEETLNSRAWNAVPLHRSCWLLCQEGSQLKPASTRIQTPYLCSVSSQGCHKERCRIMVVSDDWPN